MGCGFFSLLLRSKSGASWSASLVHPLTQWFGAAAGADCAWLPVRHGGFWKNFLFDVPFAALFAPGNLDFAFALVSSSPSVFGCCLWSTLYSAHVPREAFGDLHIFSTCGALRPVAFLSILRRMEKCAQLMLRVAVFLRVVRTLDLDIISTSSSCDGVGLTHFTPFFALLRVVPELSASFSSPRW